MTLALAARNFNLYGGMAYTKSFKMVLDICFDLFQQSDLVDDDMSGEGIVCCADRPNMDMMNILDMRVMWLATMVVMMVMMRMCHNR